MCWLEIICTVVGVHVFKGKDSSLLSSKASQSHWTWACILSCSALSFTCAHSTHTETHSISSFWTFYPSSLFTRIPSLCPLLYLCHTNTPWALRTFFFPSFTCNLLSLSLLTHSPCLFLVLCLCPHSLALSLLSQSSSLCFNFKAFLGWILYLCRGFVCVWVCETVRCNGW